MIHPSTSPISNVKLKRVSKVYHIIYNNSAGKKIVSKCKCTELFTRKLRTLLYYVHNTTYNQTKCKCQRVLIVQFYILVRFHTRGFFCARLYVRVSNSFHLVTYSRNSCTNKPGHKIY